MTNKSAEGMKRACVDAGKRWIDGLESVFEGVPDARFRDGEERSVGRLNENLAMRERMEALIGGNVKKGEGVERGYYVSSPFYSRGGKSS
ncbi:hypothetical protein BDV19DRAFT_357307 [Aspergillus venezuelensis]